AEYGDYTRGPRVIDARVREQLQKILVEIQSGAFTKELDAEIKNGDPRIQAGRRRAREHLLETVGGKLRAMMPWLKK
ncbi:MAG: ketol-acid reductoisomerase, partial [Gammaproteobacteria bacterium]|nr:ketol-acid reductoisomerase [Gammaproteobacteria bacterium]